MTQALQETRTDNNLLVFFTEIEDTYSAHIRDFVQWLDGGKIDFPAIREYFIYLNTESPFSPGTIRIKRQAVKKRLRDFAFTIKRENRAEIEDFLKVLDHDGETKAPKLADGAKIKEQKYLSRSELKELLLKARSRRQIAFIRFLSAHGCRIDELTGIKLADCHQVIDSYYIKIKGKGKKYRKLRVSEDLYKFVRETFRGETYLFETANGKRYSNSYISNQIKKLGKAVLRRSISAHTLRHSFATEAVKRSIPVDAVADYLGHSSPGITLKMYCHNEMGSADLQGMDVYNECI